jgi:hypothetical protein
MKHVKLFEQFLNEAETFDGLRSKFEKNPYGIGAQLAYYEEGTYGAPDTLVFKHDDKYSRDQIMSKLKAMGIPSKYMRKSMERGYKYPYVLTVTKF